MTIDVYHKPSRLACFFKYSLMVIAVLLFLNGCVALQPFPNAARSGDTITLAVGSADGMSVSNTTVEFFSDADPNTPHPVPIRSIFKVYPDKSSQAWIALDPLSIPRRSSHGGWLTVIAADLPILPEGPGVIRVTTTSEVKYPRFSANPNNVDITFEILPGTGGPNTFDYSVIDGSATTGDLSKLEAPPQVIVKPPVPAEGNAEAVVYGAIEMDLTVPITTPVGGPVEDAGIAVILDDQPQNLLNQTQLIWSRTGDAFKVIIVSPKGMFSHEARFSIVPRFPDYPYGVSGTPTLDSVTYYDINGNVSNGPSLTLINIPNPYF